VSLARAGEAWIAKDLARTWTLCENAFTIAAAQKKLAPSLNALDCLGEVAVKQGQAVKALPFYTKFLADHGAAMATHTARFRIRNNRAVLLHESGKFDEAIAGLREVVAAAEDPGPINYPVYLTLARNLAIAWYGAASGAEAKAWVGETGAWLQEKLEPDPAGRIGGYRGSTRALEALIAIGERQANGATPQWRQLVEQVRGREEELEKHDPLWRRLCETIKLGEIGLVACVRELSGS
jgi:tetratricopeptide (TPR) repeat protein